MRRSLASNRFSALALLGYSVTRIVYDVKAYMQ